MIAAAHGADAASVLRTLIVGLGGFATVSALILAGWNLWTWQRRADEVASLAAFLFGALLLSFAGLCALTTDHIYRHLLADETAAWQLWLSLLSFTIGVLALLALLTTRFDRSPPSK